MKRLLILAAVGEGLAGLILFINPPIVIRLFFDTESAGAGVLMSRIAGIALIALGVACWPDGNMFRAFLAMLIYSVLAILYLTHAGLSNEAGVLLWPGVAAHAGLSVLLVRAWRRGRHLPESAKSQA
jgi:hypothetical protein